MSLSTSSRSEAMCSRASRSVYESFSFCETAWASWPLRLEQALLERAHALGGVLQFAPKGQHFLFERSGLLAQLVKLRRRTIALAR